MDPKIEEAKIVLEFLERHKKQLFDRRIEGIINYVRGFIPPTPREGHFSNPNENEVKKYLREFFSKDEDINLSMLDKSEYIGKNIHKYVSRDFNQDVEKYWFKENIQVGERYYIVYYSINTGNYRKYQRIYGQGEVFTFNGNTLQPSESKTVKDYYNNSGLDFNFKTNLSGLPENVWFVKLQDTLVDLDIHKR